MFKNIFGTNINECSKFYCVRLSPGLCARAQLRGNTDRCNECSNPFQTESTSADGKQVQLLPNYDVYVNKLNLQIIVNEALSHKEGAALYVLRRLIPLVFTWNELACSRGQGLNCKSTDDIINKFPLDPMRVLACKAYMRKFCLESGNVEPSERAINQTFSHQVNYARRRVKGIKQTRKAARKCRLPIVQHHLHHPQPPQQQQQQQQQKPNNPNNYMQM